MIFLSWHVIYKIIFWKPFLYGFNFIFPCIVLALIQKKFVLLNFDLYFS